MKIKYILCIIAGVFLVLFVITRSESGGSNVYGVNERVFLPEVSTASIKAKLDTGALTSSLGADDIELFQKDGRDWVRFTPQIKDARRLERPLARHSEIKRRVAETDEEYESDKRPVVLLEICFAGKKYSMEVNLADRSRFNYPLLLGRASLVEFGALVDPAREYTITPSCGS
ncbi:MAG: ATP-dependent zinc protease [Deltaproteobacteria bacterium]|jgi:hypothetical protein|nr:ATP-dependent zinc protease [Deltaproteobacteria bacterium]